MLALDNGRLRVLIRPELGAGLARFDYRDGEAVWAVFRPEPADGPSGPFDLAMIVLAPWSNRVSDGGFDFDGHHHALAPNVAGEPFPLHGNAFQSIWSVAALAPSQVRLSLFSDQPGPYRYAAELVYALEGLCLRASLRLRNTGSLTLPYGLGFHPWLPREAGTRLYAPATGVWHENEWHLPSGDAPASVPADWNFSEARPLPSGFINNSFVGWRGSAAVHWQRRNFYLDIVASDELSTYVVYSPGAEATFFCFEPVSHPVDAFHLPGGAATNGLVFLAPGETMSVSSTFSIVLKR